MLFVISLVLLGLPNYEVVYETFQTGLNMHVRKADFVLLSDRNTPSVSSVPSISGVSNVSSLFSVSSVPRVSNVRLVKSY